MIDSKQKVIGVVGGMGPYATVSFFQELVDLTPAKKDWEHLHIIIDDNPKIPSRTRAVLYGETSPVEGIVKSINGLQGMGAEVVTLPCNSAHYFFNDIISKINIPLLNLVEIASDGIKKRGLKKPLILGSYVTTHEKLYSEYLPEAIYPQGEWAEMIIDFIEEIKLKSEDVAWEEKRKYFQVIQEYWKQIDSVILACTELSIVFRTNEKTDIPIIDSTLEYARATVAYARGKNIYD